MLRAALTLGLTIISSGSLHGATIRWSTPAQIIGPSDVIQSGSPFQLNDFGSSALVGTTVNGMNFLPFGGDQTFGPLTVGNLTFAPENPHDMGGIALFGSASSPYADLPAAYQTMIGSSYYVDDGQLTVTISGLQAGTAYQLRLWVNDSRDCCALRTEVLNSNGSQVTLKFNTAGAEGGLGQFVTGSFVADGTSQSFTVTGSDPVNGVAASQVNGLEILQVTNPCDLNGDGTSTVADVQAMISQAQGLASPISDLNGDNAVNIVDVQEDINGVLHQSCSTTIGTTAVTAHAYRSLRAPARAGITDFETRAGRPFLLEAGTVAYGFNSRTGIVGSAWFDDSSANHAFLFNGAMVSDLGTLGGTESAALAISSSGLIVGWADTSDGKRHAFLWSSGNMVDLNDFVSLEEEVVLEEATSIDNAGQISAHGSDGRMYRIALPYQFR